MDDTIATFEYVNDEYVVKAAGYRATFIVITVKDSEDGFVIGDGLSWRSSKL
ncbi:MAG: hypothetical protein LUD29_04135 [Clostridia bacterium]|nr:hypothetical protein [Clostridia bacterium]